jgi:hypothetical protein
MSQLFFVYLLPVYLRMKKQPLPYEESYFLRELGRKIQKKATVSVSEFYDCKKLSEKMAEQRIIISTHTLARFFGILKSDHRPYTSTLNLLANYVDYASFYEFKISVKRHLEYALANPLWQFQTGEFSYTALELSIHSHDWKSVKIILESFQFMNRESKNDMTMFLGNSVRQHADKESFLKALVEIENGRELFYESFVDEDDPGNYYSDALSNFYVKTKNHLEKSIFHTCFVNSKKIYKNQQIQKMDNNLIFDKLLDFQLLHFHQVSRIIEMRILLDSIKEKNSQKMDKYILDVLTIIPKYSNYEKCWVLARTIKALAFTQTLDKALEISEFKQAVFSCYQKMDGKVLSIAELTIQFTVHAHRNQFQENMLPPFSIQEKHLNETNARIAIESATTLLYAEGAVKEMIEKNMSVFAQKTGNGWVTKITNQIN